MSPLATQFSFKAEMTLNLASAFIDGMHQVEWPPRVSIFRVMVM